MHNKATTSEHVPRLTLRDFNSWGPQLKRPHHEKYLAMYSSVYGGIVTEPVLMMIPTDDHMAHRGDAVFETFKCVGGSIYNLEAHLERLTRSAAAIAIRSPWSMTDLFHIIKETIRAGNQRDCTVRLFLSRGPGSLGVNPYDCPTPALYIMVAVLSREARPGNEEGATAITSSIPPKDPFYAKIKSCNYLPNALMKKEAVDAGADFVIAFDSEGFLTEGPSENAGIVSAEGCLMIPQADHILAGTTMERVMSLAEQLITEGQLSGATRGNITRAEILAARELLILGTTPDVASVATLDGQTIGDGRPGTIAQKLRELLLADMTDNANRQTPVFDTKS